MNLIVPVELVFLKAYVAIIYKVTFESFKEWSKKLMDKRFWGIVAGIVVVFLAIFFVTNHSGSGSNFGKPSEHIEGLNKDNVSLVEYGDYECPYCGQYFPIVKQVASLYYPYISFQFRNLPLTSIHPDAYAGARAAEAAALQNKFWQMHDLLYETQAQWTSTPNPDPYFSQYAKQLGLNVNQFTTDFNSNQVNNTIEADINAFNQTGASESTPTFFLDGKQINPTESLASFETLLNQAIQKKTGKPSPITITNAPGSSSAPKSRA